MKAHRSPVVLSLSHRAELIREKLMILQRIRAINRVLDAWKNEKDDHRSPNGPGMRHTSKQAEAAARRRSI